MRPGALSIDQVVGSDFRIVRPLDEGGMGALYVAMQLSTGKERALKVMHPELVADPALRDRFTQEARVGSRVHSEHIVEVVAAGVDGPSGLPFLVMELLQGETLRGRLRRGGPLFPEETRRVFEQMCHAVGAAHAAGIVHRDLKPENVFLARVPQAGGPPFVVKVLDFGIAKLVAEAGPQSHTGALGSPLWMAPEQTQRGPVTPAADVWALGLIAFELLTGKSFWLTPHEQGGTTAQLMREILVDPLPPASARADVLGRKGRLPPAFDAWFASVTAREPSARLPDASQAWQAMQVLFDAAAPAPPLAFAPTSPAPPPASPLASTGPSRDVTPFVNASTAPTTPRTLPIALAVTTALAAGALFAWLRPPGSRDASKEHRPDDPAAVTAKPPAPFASAPTPPESPTHTIDTTGFHDPVDVMRAPAATPGVLLSMDGHHVRLFTRVEKNATRMSDDRLRESIDANSWRYLECYRRAFAGVKVLPAGTVEIAFSVEDQALTHTTVEAPGFDGAAAGQCVADTVRGLSVNETAIMAGGAGAGGRVRYAFRFVPLD